MLEKPDLEEDWIAAGLLRAYGVRAAAVEFLPLGADQWTAVYRVSADSGVVYFLKLRRGVFDPNSVTLPRFLREKGIDVIIAPLRTITGQPWAELGTDAMILYPYVEGRNGFELVLSDRHWVEIGRALRKLHTVELPAEIGGLVKRETYAPRYRSALWRLLERVAAQDVPGTDSLVESLVAFLDDKWTLIDDLVRRADRLARVLQAQPRDFVLCHSDVHAGNVLVATDGTLYIVDWDDPILAPKERDLMFAGGAQGFAGRSPEEEEALFYRGYGPVEVDAVALAYYRYERIVVDIALFAEDVLSALPAEAAEPGGEDREQSFGFLRSSFDPNGTIELAYRSDRSGRVPGGAAV
jgi:spectinomycin phosphotransferase